MTLPDTPLSPEAASLLARIRPRVTSRLLEVNSVPVGILLWGPGISTPSPLASVRLGLRTLLRQNGHAAVYSEEICDSGAPYSIRLQQLAQAQEFDLIVSIPATPGAVGEVHDFAADRRVNAKLLVFLNQEQLSGYSPQSLKAVSTIVSCQIEYYSCATNTDIITQRTMEEAQRIREMKYILAGRF